MKYNKFIIHSYSGITVKTEIDISKDPLIPIIGKNESGKTTFLEAIFAFDSLNDEIYEGRQLKNIDNLYSTDDLPIKVEAEIDCIKKNFWASFFSKHLIEYENDYHNSLGNDEKINFLTLDFNYIDNETQETAKFTKWEYVRAFQIFNGLPSTILNIVRDLKTLRYEQENLSNEISVETIDDICTDIIGRLPYILYFDDFRDRLPEKIFLIDDENNPLYSPWITYINELFKQTKNTYNASNLTGIDDKRRKSIIKEVQKELNKKLVEEWSNYQFEKNQTIEVQIEYESGDLPYLKFSIEEKVLIDGEIKERYFDISDRSKGFYWYMNFMIKLHYNPKKRNNEDNDTVYLLDEPGSYLHTYALGKLAEQLKKISKKNKVIYCTHSHNLLNPEVIPINSIRLAEKNDGKITLKRIEPKKMIRPSKNSAYQSIFDALEVKPPLLEFDYDKIVLLEGIYDFYSFNMFTTGDLAFFPCVSASSIINQISYMIFLGKPYIALWDNDPEGRSRLSKAAELFGEHEAKKFMTLHLLDERKDVVLENLYCDEEVKAYTKSDEINKEFLKKTILELYYSPTRKRIISKQFPKTLANFSMIEKVILDKI